MRQATRQTLMSLVLFGGFAGLCAWLHGPQPDLNIDHLAYLRRADALLTQYPAGDFWRGFEARNTYAIMLAWLHGWTTDHILSLKLLLAAMTVAWLAGLEWWFRALPLPASQARLAALLGGIHLSFGAPQWGVSSFDDSLHRTLVMPLLFVLLGWYWRQRDRTVRLLAIPLAATLCLVHLGSAYLLGVLTLVELLNCWRPTLPRLDRARLIAALVAAGLVLALIQFSGLALSPEAAGRLIPATAATDRAMLVPAEAWAVELAALRWRNFPPTAASLVVIAASAGPLIFLGFLGGFAAQRRPEWAEADRFMRRFALAALLFAFGWQACLSILRHLLPVYPLNFEEIRAVVWVAPPLIYFGFRGIVTSFATPGRLGLRLLLCSALSFAIVQPVQWARLLPKHGKEWLLKVALPPSADTPNNLIRTRVARQWLGLQTNEPRFYYDALGLVTWLRTNVSPGQRVLTDRDECRLGPAQVIGSPTGFLGLDFRQPPAKAWLELSRELQSALAAKDVPRLLDLARTNHADYVVIPGPVPGASYTDAYFSVLAVPPVPRH